MPPATPPPDPQGPALEMAEGPDPAQPFDPKGFVDSLPARPGVYRMLDAAGQILYVGKARNLKSRVGSYFQRRATCSRRCWRWCARPRTWKSPSRTRIPRRCCSNSISSRSTGRGSTSCCATTRAFRICTWTTAHDFPRLSFYRGSRKEAGRFFGPYPSAGAVRETLSSCRSCSGCAIARTPTSPIARGPACSTRSSAAPRPASGSSARRTTRATSAPRVKVLEGRNDEVSVELAAAHGDRGRGGCKFEEAARAARPAREAARACRRSRSSPPASTTTRTSSRRQPATASTASRSCSCAAAQPRQHDFLPEGAVRRARGGLAAFVAQYYLEREAPAEIIVEREFDGCRCSRPRSPERAGHRVRIRRAVRGIRARWVEMMRKNAEQALKMRLATRGQHRGAARGVCAASISPRRRRASSASTSATRGGTDTVASCVVFGAEGPHEERIPAFQHRGHRAGRRLRRDASGARPALQARARRRDAQRPTSA